MIEPGYEDNEHEHEDLNYDYGSPEYYDENEVETQDETPDVEHDHHNYNSDFESEEF